MLCLPKVLSIRLGSRFSEFSLINDMGFHITTNIRRCNPHTHKNDWRVDYWWEVDAVHVSVYVSKSGTRYTYRCPTPPELTLLLADVDDYVDIIIPKDMNIQLTLKLEDKVSAKNGSFSTFRLQEKL